MEELSHPSSCSAMQACVSRQGLRVYGDEVPAFPNRFPAPVCRESVATASGSTGNSGPAPPGPSRAGRIPCTFSAYQGTDHGDEFGPDSPHRHLVCGCIDFRQALENSPRKLRDSAGSWEPSPRLLEPETAGSGHRRHRCSCFSLLPSWAVRLRFRFAPAKT
jgi:hypothetical protein